MDLIGFIGKKVKIVCDNSYYYIGEVLNADNDSLDLLDMRGNRVSLAKISIHSIQEVSSNGK